MAKTKPVKAVAKQVNEKSPRVTPATKRLNAQYARVLAHSVIEALDKYREEGNNVAVLAQWADMTQIQHGDAIGFLREHDPRG